MRVSTQKFRTETYQGIKEGTLKKILSSLSGVKAALIGDLGLDIYWKADMTKSEMSRETPHYPLPVVKEWMSPGAAGNAAANIATLGPAALYLIGVIGNDWRGRLLMEQFSRYKNINAQGVTISDSRVTCAYCKPIRKGISDLEYEDPRIDFANFSPLSGQDEAALLKTLDGIYGVVDVLCVSDQFEYGCITPKIREKLMDLGAKGLCIVVDSRDRIDLYSGVILKPNEIEGWRAVNGENPSRDITIEDQVETAFELARKNHAGVCMTLGSKGCVYSDGKKAVYVPSYDVKPPLDICGAGDTFLSAFSCALAAGASEIEAASFANMAADVTIKKIGTTGTAHPEEIQKRHQDIFGA